MRQNSHCARTLTVLELSLCQNSHCARGCARTLLALTTYFTWGLCFSSEYPVKHIIFTHQELSNEPYTVPHHQRLQKKAVKRKHGKPEVTVMYEKEADNIIA